jgi:hypothetical protein
MSADAAAIQLQRRNVSCECMDWTSNNKKETASAVLEGD